jgi:signal transduction histidine kinase
MHRLTASMKHWWIHSPGIADTVLAAFTLMVTWAGELAQRQDNIDAGRANSVQLVHSAIWTVALIAPLAVRRRVPVAATLWLVTAFCVHRVLGVPERLATSVVLLFAIASVGIHARDGARHTVRVVCAVMIVALNVAGLFHPNGAANLEPTNRAALGFTVASNIALFGAAWVLGDAYRGRLDREAQLIERTRELETQRFENARRAVAEERLRIARDMHDVVGHHVSIMGVQAGAARHVLTRHPDQAASALGIIETSSRSAVDELRRLVGLLRDDEQPDGDTTVAQLDDLITIARENGVEVHYEVVGTQRPLPPSVEQSTYRVVQEALTNVRKHALVKQAHVTVSYGPDVVDVKVESDRATARRRVVAPSCPSPQTRSHGLIGMNERVTLHGGVLTVGRTDDGYVVHASIPVGIPS